MSRGDSIERAIADGKQNAGTMVLIKNWCAHVRVQKMGGVGLVEEQTGYPIGHHALQCDHAPIGGMGCWDLRDSALDFYDRNCVACTKRQPVALPNISVLVGERDRARAARDAEIERFDQASKKLAEVRQARRDALRPELSPVAMSILDDIAAFDADHSAENFDRLRESARLAPEHFDSKLVEYLFQLSEGENWFQEAGLSMLQRINADPGRLARLAADAVRHPAAYEVAAEIIIAKMDWVLPADVGKMVRPAIEKASPSHEHFIGGPYPEPKPELLQKLWGKFAREVREALEALLSSRKRYAVELAGRGFAVLLAVDPAAADASARTLASLYARAPLLVDDLDDRHKHLPHLNDAVAGAFASEPESVDAIVQQLIDGSDRASRARAFEIYSHALKGRGYRSERTLIPPDSKAHRIAFRRLLWAPTVEVDEKIIRAAQDVFRGEPYELELIAKAEIDGLLGAVLLLDDRLKTINDEPRAANEDWITTVGRGNRRSAISGLMGSYIEWAAIAAAKDELLIGKVIDMIDAIPADREELKGIALGAIEHLAASVTGLKRMLPHLYYGIVGSSAIVRSYAAEAFGKIRHVSQQNIPPLLFEAFFVLLWDQYVVVHKSAVHALQRVSVPEAYSLRAAHAVLNLLMHYGPRAGDDKFKMDCVELLVGLGDAFGDRSDAVRELLIETMLRIDPLYVRSDIQYLSRRLSTSETFTDLVIQLFPNLDEGYHRDAESLALLRRLPDVSVLKRQDKLVSLGIAMLKGRPWQAYEIVECLSLAGASVAARQLADACVTEVPDIVRMRAIRTEGRFLSIAHAFEAAVAAADTEEMTALEEQWNHNVADKRQQKEDARERGSRTDFPIAN